MIEPRRARAASASASARPTALVRQGRSHAVKQIFVNLLSTPSSTTASAARSRSVAAPDRGPHPREFSGHRRGLAADKLAQLFQPFNRLGQEAASKKAPASAWWSASSWSS